MLRYKPVAAGEKNVFPGRSFAGDLLLGDDDGAFGRAFERAAARFGVRGVHAFAHGDGESAVVRQEPLDTLGRQQVVFLRESVPPVRDRIDGISFGTQRLDGFPHCVAAHADGLGHGGADTWRSRLSSSKRSSCSLVPMGSMIGRGEEVVNEKCELG